MSHETVISVKKHGKWRKLGDAEPPRERPALPMPLRLPKPLSLDEDGTFNCAVETSCKCPYAKMWRFVAVWHETPWVRAYVTQRGTVRPDLPDDDAEDIAKSVLDQFSIGKLVFFADLDCEGMDRCTGAKQVLDEYGYCATCSSSLMYAKTAHLGVCETCYRNAQTAKETT